MAYYPRIKDLRDDSDKNQPEVAEYMGTTAQHYGQYERGQVEIPFERAILLAKYYNVSLDYIAGLTNNKKGLAASDLSDEQQELLRLIGSMSREEKEKLTELIRLICKM